MRVTLKRYNGSSWDTLLVASETVSHAAATTTYGAGTSSAYGHVKLGDANQNGATAADGVAAPNGHTHSQYALASNIPSVGNGTVTIKANGTTVGSFTMNQSGNTELNILPGSFGLSQAMSFIGIGKTATQFGSTTGWSYYKFLLADTDIYVGAANSGQVTTELTAKKGMVFILNDTSGVSARYQNTEWVVTTEGTYGTNTIEELGSQSSFALAGHAHNYAGSSSAGGAATSANKLNTNAGSATQPVYFSNGIPVATTYSLSKSVPSDAKFTDTTYESKSASSGGTAVSLVTTGEKYTWNSKAAGDHNHNGVYSAVGHTHSQYLTSHYTASIFASDSTTNTTPNVSSAVSNPYVVVKENDAISGYFKISGSGATSVTAQSGNITISSTDTNTTYSAGTGMSLSGTTFNHSNSVTAQTTQALYPIKIDAQGHISAYGSAVTSLPASDVYSWAKASSKPSYTASEVGALKNYGASTARPNGTTFTLPGGTNAVQMRSGATSGGDIGILHLSDDNAFICNSSDTGYLFAAFDTDKTTDFSSATNAAFVVKSDHAGVGMKGDLAVAGSITSGGTAVSLDGHTHSQYLTSHQDISGKADKVSMTAGTYKRVTVNSQGIVTAGDNVDANDNTWRPIAVGGTNKLTDSSTTLNFAGSGATSVSYSNGTITISSTDTNTNTWRPVSGTGSSDNAARADHTHTTFVGSYTSNGGQQGPTYFGTNKVGALMMNTTVNSNSQYKDWLFMDCYSGNDVGGAVAFGVNRQSLGAYIMRSNSSNSGRSTSWNESAELIGTHNLSTYVKAWAQAASKPSYSFSGSAVTSGKNSGTNVSVITGISGGSGSLTSVSTQGTGDLYYVTSGSKTTVLTGVKASGTTNAYTSLTTKYFHPSFSSGSAAASSSTTAVYNSLTTKYFHPSFTGSSVTSGGNSGTAVAAVTGVTGGTTSATTKYLSASFSGSSVTSGGNSGTNVSAVTGYGSFSGGSGSLTVSSTQSTGDIQFFQGSVSNGVLNLTTAYLHHSHTGASLGTPSTSSCAPASHTHSVTASGSVSLTANDATATGRITYVQGISSTGASATGTSNCAPAGHTHSVTASGSVSLGSNTTSTDGVAYIASGSTTNVASSGHTHTVTGTVSLGSNDTSSGGTAYISAGSTSSVVTGVASNGTVDAYTGLSGAYLHHTHTGASTAATTSVSPAEHTHSVTAAGSVS